MKGGEGGTLAVAVTEKVQLLIGLGYGVPILPTVSSMNAPLEFLV